MTRVHDAGECPRFELREPQLLPHQLKQLCAMFAGEWWSRGRSPEDVRAIVANSQIVVCVVETQRDDRLVGFARVVTDLLTFAVVLDVIVDVETRGQGVGSMLIDAIFAHPKLQELRGIGVQCEPALIPFYARWGFSDAPGRTRTLKRVFNRAAGERPGDVVQH